MSADAAVSDTTLSIACQAMVQQGRELDALGVYWLAGWCTWP